MKKVIEHLYYLTPKEGTYGIEIEVEGSNLPSPDNRTAGFSRIWNITQDGSLRGKESWEYVLRDPLSIESAFTALDLLNKEYEAKSSIIDDTIRAGIHIHVNVQQLTLQELVTFMCLYYAFEESLISFCGEGRAGNHFCLRASDAEYIISSLFKAISTGKVGHLAGDNIRYSAMNVTSLFKYGSLEFRSLRSTRDMERIKVWICLLGRLLTSVKLYKHPQDIVRASSMYGAENFAKDVFGPFFHHIDGPNLRRGIIKGVRYIQDLAFLCDMDTFDQFFNTNGVPREEVDRRAVVGGDANPFEGLNRVDLAEAPHRRVNLAVRNEANPEDGDGEDQEHEEEEEE